MKRYALVIDYKYCTGCHSCEVACAQEKNFDIDDYGIKVVQLGPEPLGDKWYWNYVPVPSSLCDVCESRIDEGKKPACVHHCLAKCMQAVEIPELPKVLAELGDTVTCFIP